MESCCRKISHALVLASQLQSEHEENVSVAAATAAADTASSSSSKSPAERARRLSKTNRKGPYASPRDGGDGPASSPGGDRVRRLSKGQRGDTSPGPRVRRLSKAKGAPGAAGGAADSPGKRLRRLSKSKKSPGARVRRLSKTQQGAKGPAHVAARAGGAMHEYERQLIEKARRTRFAEHHFHALWG